MGKSKAMEMCLLGQPINGQQALELGLVQRLVASSALMATARRLAEQLLVLPANALSETKMLVHADEGLQSKTAFVADTAAYIRCLQDRNAKEGIAAFREKRAAKFQ
ncbi:MAG: enoyl-CoA hydratase/isomerase family protein [Planctomycetaceae bacterium]